MALCVLIGDGAVGRYVAQHIQQSAPLVRVLGLPETRAWLKPIAPDARFVSPLRFGELRRTLIEFDAHELTFAGLSFHQGISLDPLTLYYLSRRLRRWWPHTYVMAARDMFEDCRFALRSVLMYLPEISVGEDVQVRNQPSFDPTSDFEAAISYLKGLPAHKTSQAFVVDNAKVIMKAGITGTDQLIEKFGASKEQASANFPVLCKFSAAPFGVLALPVIGLTTFQKCLENGIRAIIVQADRTLFMDRSASLDFAERNSIGFFALRSDNLDDST